jgi:FkbM family methyltransferase
MNYTDGNVLDIGAHIGLHSIAFNRMIPSNRKVFSFEAHPTIFEVLKRNCEQCSNVIPFHNAVSDKPGQIVYVDNVDFDSVVHQNSGGLGTNESKRTHGDLHCITTSIDSHHFENVTLVKIDVEGNEMNVLAGMSEMLRTQKPVLFVEIHSTDRAEKLRQIEEMYNYTSVEQLSDIDFIFRSNN